MGEFFKPWRRKIGCVTLVMALVFMLGWVRSLVVQDDIWIVVEDGTRYGLKSWEGGIEYLKMDIGNSFPHFGRRAIVFRKKRATQPLWILRDSMLANDTRVLVNWVGFPYWSIVIPLTLLSAYLILWPGKQPAKRLQIDQTPAEGA
jgi:hypothetical protein